jgi:glycosyltransferase involved in cell wall biosynthesis/O-antigen/teichoic acid export membrane protein
VGNSVALLALIPVSSLLGYLFWMACARHVSATAVGTTNTVISAMTLVAILTAAGFEPLLTRLLPGANARERSGLFSTALVLTAVASSGGGAVGALLLPDSVRTAVGAGWLVTLLAAGSAGTALLLVVNAALLGVRRAELSLFGTTVASLSRLTAVGALLSVGLLATAADTAAARTILTVWVGSLAVSLFLSLRLFARATPGFRFRPGTIWLARLRGAVAWEHVATLGTRSPDFALPLMAAAMFPADQVAYLVMAWMVSGAFVSVSTAITNALLADCADRPEKLRAQVNRALWMMAALVTIPVIVTSLLAAEVLGLFGADYAEHSTLLVVLLLSAFPVAVIELTVTILRVRRKLAEVAAMTVTDAVVTLVSAWLLMSHFGILGAGLATLGTSMIVATTVSAIAFRRSRIPARATGAVTGNQGAPSAPLYMSCRRMKPAEAEQNSRGLRVLHATDSFLPNVGGLELSIASLVRFQAARGYAVAVATAPHAGAADRQDMDGVLVHRLPMAMASVPGAYADRNRLFFPPVPDPVFARSFADLIRTFKPDVIHAHGWVLYSVLGAAKRAGVPVVATAHDHSQVCATKTMLYRGERLCTGPGLRKCTGCAFGHYGVKGIPLAVGLYEIGSRRHREVAQWMAASSALAARGSAPRPADHRHVEVIPTFIEDDLLALAGDERTAARPDFVPPEGPYLFYAGALGTHKGVDVLLDAHAILAANDLDVPLVLAGLPRPDFHVDERPGVVVVTHVPHTEVVAAWRHAAAGVVPSRVPEGFGLVAVECLAAGTPCVVSALGGLLDVVADGVEGLHVPPGDAEALAGALQRLLRDEGLRMRLGEAGPAKAAQFTLSHVAPRVEAVYTRVIDSETTILAEGVQA